MSLFFHSICMRRAGKQDSLDRLLIASPGSTYLLEREAPYCERQILIVDRAIPPSIGRCVIIGTESGFKIARYNKELQATYWGTLISAINKGIQ